MVVLEGYEFNFENYREKSVDVCLEHLNFAMNFYIFCIAA